MDGWRDLEWTWMHPQWLLLLLPGVLLLLLGHVRSLGDAPAWQRWSTLLVRTLTLVLLALALTGLVYLQTTEQQMIVFAVDRSASVDEEGRRAVAEFLSAAIDAATEQPETSVRVLPFDAQPGSVVDAASLDEPRIQSMLGLGQDASAEDREGEQLAEPAASQPGSLPGDPNRLGTNLAAAIRAAAASVPPTHVPRVVLLSDGNATAGDAVAAASRSDVPVWTVPLPERSQPEVQLAAVEAPAHVRQGQPFHVNILINANVATSGYLDVYRDDVRVSAGDEGPMEIQPGENRVRVQQSIADAQQTTFTARLRGFGEDDTLLENNEATAIIHSDGQPRILVVDPDPDQTDSLRWALEEQQIGVDSRPPSGMPTELMELERYDCLILSNVPATAISIQQMEMIRTYVQDSGGGLVMLGGDQAFGLGGYYQTQLEQVLPVRSNFEKEREKPSLAMALVIDKSGSMGGARIALAKEAARAAVELLGPRDAIGVVAFDGQAYWVSEMRPASDRGAILDRLSTIEASGGTNMYPAIEEAYQSLLAANAKVKHCIVLTDGQSSPADFEGLAADMAASGITLSTIAMGDEATTELLERMARIGQGRFYFCSDPQSVPQVFAKETMEASKSAINELPFLPVVMRPTQVLDGIDVENAPFLLGYVVTRPKLTSEVILATEAGDPLLAWWRYGLGMSVAFTSDAKSRWAAEWLAWPEFAAFWAQIVRHAMRQEDPSGLTLELHELAEETEVTVDLVDDAGRFIHDAQANVVVVDPQQNRTDFPLRLTAPGRFSATVPTPARGTYHVELTVTRDTAETLRRTRSLVRGYPEELRLLPPNESALRSIARVSDGRYAPDAVESVAPSAERNARRPVPMWPWLLMTAMCLFIADVGLRRLQRARG